MSKNKKIFAKILWAAQHSTSKVNKKQKQKDNLIHKWMNWSLKENKKYIILKLAEPLQCAATWSSRILEQRTTSNCYLFVSMRCFPNVCLYFKHPKYWFKYDAENVEAFTFNTDLSAIFFKNPLIKTFGNVYSLL